MSALSGVLISFGGIILFCCYVALGMGRSGYPDWRIGAWAGVAFALFVASFLVDVSRDPRCDGPARYEAMAEGKSCN